ncbi:MAG TPA: PAS domain S-box protein [Methanospirillum sp.]|nr:PAS domain S-box protein [Methanospirillum sp.]
MNHKSPYELVPHLLKDPSSIEYRILNAMSEFLVFHDRDLRILWANAAACASVDQNLEAITGQYCFEVWQKRSTPCEDCPLLNVITSGEPQDAKVTTVQGRVLHVRGYPVFDDQSIIIGLLEFIEDITDQVRAEEALQDKNRDLQRALSEIKTAEEKIQAQYQKLAENERIITEKDDLLTNIIHFLPDPTFAVDKEGTIIAWNQAMVALTGLSSRDMVGSKDLSIVKTIYGGVHPPLIQFIFDHAIQNFSLYPSIIQKGDRLESELFSPSYNKNGSFIWITASPLYDSSGRIIGCIESIRDISDRKKAEELAIKQESEQELLKINEELHAAYEELTASEEELRANYQEHLKTERELQESEEKFRSLVEYSFESIVILDMQGTIIFANQAISDLLEVNEIPALMGRNVMEFVAPESQNDVMRDFMQVSQGIDGFISEYQGITAKGKRIYIESVGKCITYQGQPADLLSVHDITVRIQNQEALRQQNEVINTAYHELAVVEEDLRNNYNEILVKERNLRESEERFRAIFSIVPDPIILTRICDGTIIDCNQALVEMIGIPYETILGTSTIDFCVWKNAAEREAFLHEIRQTGFLNKRELLWRNNQGDYLNILFSSRIIEIQGEKVILSVGFDYTSLKAAEDALRESEEMFRSPVENSPVGIFLYQNGYFRYNNRHLGAMLGYSHEELLQTPIETFFSSSDIDRIRENLHKSENNLPFEDHLEIQGVRSDGIMLDLELYASRTQYGGSPAIFGTIIDVTEKKQNEKLRLASESKYRLITEHMKDVVWILDIDTWHYTYVSPSIQRLLGYSAEEVMEKPSSDALIPEVFYCFQDTVRMYLERFLSNPTKTEFFITQLEQPCKDGSTVMTEAITNFFVNRDTGKVELLGVSRDISDRKKVERELERKTLELYGRNEDLYAANADLTAIEKERRIAYEALEKNQQALKESERSLKKAQSIAHLGVWEWDVAKGQVYVSDEFRRILGLDSSESPLFYSDLFAVITPQYQDQFDSSMKALMNFGSPFTLEFWIIRDDGSNRAIRGQGESDSDVEGRSGHLTLIIQDITEQKLMEKEIQEASLEKEILLREIHHRVKNNMQVISSLLSMQSRTIKEPTVQSLFKETQTRVRSLALVHELLYQSDTLNKINYHDYLQRITNYLFNSYNISQGGVTCTIQARGIEFSIDIAVPCSLIITELLTNSLKYAFTDERKGEIIIILSYDPDTLNYSLDYRDNGQGFPPGYDPKKGTGFGSSLIVGLIRQLSGNVEIENVERGVHYSITFPGDEK